MMCKEKDVLMHYDLLKRSEEGLRLIGNLMKLTDEQVEYMQNLRLASLHVQADDRVSEAIRRNVARPQPASLTLCQSEIYLRAQIKQ